MLARHAGALAGARTRHRQVQQVFREAAARCPTQVPSGRFADHASMPLMRELNASLAEPVSADAHDATFSERLTRLDALGAAMLPRFAEVAEPSDKTSSDWSQLVAGAAA